MPPDFHTQNNCEDFSDMYEPKIKTIEEQLNELKHAEAVRENVAQKISDAEKNKNASDMLNAFAPAYAAMILQNADVSNFMKLAFFPVLTKTIKLAVNSTFEVVSLANTEKEIDYAEETNSIFNKYDNTFLKMILITHLFANI